MENTAGLRLAVMGDICMRNLQDTMNEEMARRALEELRPILDAADLRIANLENPVTPPDQPIAKNGPNLWQTEGNMAFFREAGVDCCILANNHTGDFGPEGVLSTLEVLRRQGFGYVGAGEDIAAAYRPWYAHKNGLTLGIVALCENEYGTADPLGGPNAAGAAGFDLNRAACAIREAKERADFVLVVMHGGNEYYPLPSPALRARYRTFIDLGADAVQGMHPHCIQGMETYRGAPIVYSPGNFLFCAGDPARTDPSWFYGYVSCFTFQKGGPVGVELEPYFFDQAALRIRPLTGEDKAKMLAYIGRLSAVIPDDALLRRYYMGWCMISGPPHGLYCRWDPDWTKEHAFPTGHPMLALRNIHTCEAHNELVTQYFRMVLENRLAEGAEMVDAVRELQKMPV